MRRFDPRTKAAARRSIEKVPFDLEFGFQNLSVFMPLQGFPQRFSTPNKGNGNREISSQIISDIAEAVYHQL